MITVEVDSSKLEKALRIAPQLLREEIADTLDHISRSFLKRLYKTRLQGPPGLRLGGRGNIFSTFQRRVLGTGKSFASSAKSKSTVDILSRAPGGVMDMGIEIFSGSKVARIHEFGGTVSGVNMPIPFPGKRLTKRAITIKLGNRIFLARKNSKEKTLELVGIIKNSIRIRPRLGFYDTWRGMQSQNIERINTAIDKALARV